MSREYPGAFVAIVREEHAKKSKCGLKAWPFKSDRSGRKKRVFLLT